MLRCPAVATSLAPGAAGRRALYRIYWLAVAAVVSLVILTGCQVRRTLAPESTRQLRVADTRRIVDRPALSPVAWSPDGRRIVYGTARGLWVTGLDGAEQQLMPGAVVSAVSWSKVLDLLAVIDRGTVWTMRPNGTELRRLNLAGTAVDLGWAPGSDRLAVVLYREVNRDTRFELWLTTRDGGFTRMVVRAPRNSTLRDLQWFPDSLYLFYGLSAPGDERIVEAWRVRITYPDHQRIPILAPARFLRLAPSGRLIAYLSGPDVNDARGQILISRTDGSGRFPLTRQVSPYVALAWSPQGDKVVFAESHGGTTADLWIADADGSDRVHLFSYTPEFSDPHLALSVAWAPDGRRVVFGTNTGSLTGPIWFSTLARR